MAGKHILLVGSSGGIGSQLAAMFPHDMLILHHFRHQPPLTGYPVRADITDYEAVSAMVAGVLEKFEHIDVLVNAAGISLNGFAHKTCPSSWQKVIDTNIGASFNLLRAVLPSMRARRYGRVIMLSSVVAQRPTLGTSAYCASKAALEGLTRSAALENAALGITCNCIALGYFDAGLLYQIPPDLRERIREEIPVKRYGCIEEVYSSIRFLIDNAYVTGQTIHVDGGLTMG